MLDVTSEFSLPADRVWLNAAHQGPRRGVRLVVNGAQGVGGIPLRVHDHPIDALAGVGFKWLCGPYGTGYCWLRPDLLDRVAVSKLYWLGAMTADDLARPALELHSGALTPRPGRGGVGAPLAPGIDVDHRRGLIRFTPHFYNTPDDIDRAPAKL